MSTKIIDITKDRVNLFELKKNRILIHKQIIRKDGKIYMRLKSRDLKNVSLPYNIS